MRILAIDTETTGTVNQNWPLHNPQQPRLVQFGAALYDDATRVERSAVSLICNPTTPIPEGASNVHGITDEIASSFGVPEKLAVGTFIRMAGLADIIVAYNVSFDMSVMEIAAIRDSLLGKLPKRPTRCVMTAATPIVDMPPTQRMIDAGFGDKPKTPKLGEAYKHFFGEEMAGAHDALADVRAAMRIYWHLLDMGVWKEAA